MTDQQPIDHDAVSRLRRFAENPTCWLRTSEEMDQHKADLRAVFADRRASPPVREGEAVAWTNSENLAILSGGRGSATVWPTQHTRDSVPLFAHPPQGEAEMREKVARLIAPKGWRAYDDEVRDCKFWGTDLNPLPVAERFVMTADSLRKADAILALTGRGKGDE